ncbi:MAG: hypothetical protein AAF348_06790 [Bacteroidota bacterium]
MKKFKILLGFILLALISCSEEEVSKTDSITDPDIDSEIPFEYKFEKQYFTHKLTNTAVPYHLFEPKNAEGSNTKFPLIIALHGAEYFLTPKDKFLNIDYTGYMALAWIEKENQEKYPAYVVAPHLHEALWENNEDYFGWSNTASSDFVEKLLDHLIETANIDASRIYITGHSMGGDGTWYLGAKLQDRIAAIVPLSNAVSESTMSFVKAKIENETFETLPIWNFIHRNDSGTVYSQELFATFEANGHDNVYTHKVGGVDYDLTTEEILAEINKGQLRFHTEYSYPCSIAVCHFAMGKALREPFLFEWLFKQKRN